MTLRLADNWVRTIGTLELSFEARWHLLGIVELCTSVGSDGTISQRNAERCSDVLDANACVEELVSNGMLQRIDKVTLRVTNYRQYGPQRVAKDWISPAIRQAVYARDGYRCLACGSADDLTCDHVEPERLGGPTVVENLQTLCRVCNSAKGLDTADYRKAAAPNGVPAPRRPRTVVVLATPEGES